MKFIECVQGTEEWFASRCGKITASCFADAISRCQKKSGARSVGDPTAVAERYAADLAIERVSGRPHGEPPKAWVLERGHEMEAAARMLYEARTRSFVTEAGICVTDDGLFGYSTDGLVDDDGRFIPAQSGCAPPGRRAMLRLAPKTVGRPQGL